MEIFIVLLVLFITGSVLSLKRNTNKFGVITGILLIVISIILFWSVFTWIAIVPTIIGIIIIFANLAKGFSGSSDDIITDNHTKTANLKNSESILELKQEPPKGSYFSSIQKFKNARGDDEKIFELEKSLTYFENFVISSLKIDKELPPSIPHRDILPELYMKRGDWNEAEQVIKLCVSIGAHGYTDYSKSKKGVWIFETGADELLTLKNRGEVCIAVLQYLSENPGTLQKNIYKIPDLSSCEHDALVWFCRHSRQIRKEKINNTNKLFVVEEIVLK